jgi:predicted LPLAT superfamily acyltransferase
MRLVLGIIAVALLLFVLKRFPTSRWILAALLCIPLVFIFGPHELRLWYKGTQAMHLHASVADKSGFIQYRKLM